LGGHKSFDDSINISRPVDQQDTDSTIGSAITVSDSRKSFQAHQHGIADRGFGRI
jgi:hypothetical protein